MAEVTLYNTVHSVLHYSPEGEIEQQFELPVR